MKKLQRLSDFLKMEENAIKRGLRKLHAKDAYLIWTVPKSSGGRRTLTAPQSDLAVLHYAIANALYIYSISPVSYAYIYGRGPISCAKKHLNANVIFSFDIKDAYPSTNRNLLRKHLSFVAKSHGFSGLEDLLLDIVCYPPFAKESHLPQGSWASNVLFNLVMKDTDLFLDSIAKPYHRVITRYSDGYMVSSQDPIPKSAQQNYVRMTELLNDHALLVKREKTEYQQSLPLSLLGMEIIEKDKSRMLNIPDEKIRQYCDSLEAALAIKDFTLETVRSLRGYAARVKAVCKTPLEKFKFLYDQYNREYQMHLRLMNDGPELWQET